METLDEAIRQRVPAPGPFRLAPGPILPPMENPSRRRWRRRLVRFGTVLGVLAVLVAFHRPLLAGFAGLFRVNDPAPSDAIVMLLGGPSERPPRAAELYRKGLAPLVLLGTSTEDPNARVNETNLAIADMVQLGVPRSAIHVMPGKVTSTQHEAMKVAEFSAAHPLRRVTVITTSFHTARARWIFRKVLRGKGIDIRMAAARHPQFDERSWFRSDEGLVTYFAEAIKTLYYRLVY
ncbi:MAG: hypothetical protein JWN86_3080 [Planctomycetota bacterium]|nr:hypothetical protein [Planctomycetota bacterium]